MTTAENEIALIVATPINANAGMRTVDCVGYWVLKTEFDVRLYCLDPPTSPSVTFPIKYHDVLEKWDRIQNSAAIIYWGDFIHSWGMSRLGVPSRAKCTSRKSRDDLIEDTNTVYFLSNSDEKVLGRSVLFGGSLMPDNWINKDDVRHQELLTRLLRNAKHVSMRDPISAYRALRASLYRSHDFMGVDCATLIDKHLLCEELRFNLADFKLPSDIGVFFGRTVGSKFVYWDYVRRIANAIEGEVSWLPWLNEPSKLIKHIVRLPGFRWKKSGQNTDFSSLYRTLLSCKLVITDTYHLAVIAWSLGIPAICIGRGISVRRTMIDDKKKEIWFWMYSASAFYVYYEAIQGVVGRQKSVEQVLELLSSPDIIERITSEIQNDASKRKESLISDISELVRDAEKSAL